MKRLIVYKPLLRAFDKSSLIRALKKELLSKAFNKTNKKHKMVIYGGMLEPEETKEETKEETVFYPSETKEEITELTPDETKEEITELTPDEEEELKRENEHATKWNDNLDIYEKELESKKHAKQDAAYKLFMKNTYKKFIKNQLKLYNDYNAEIEEVEKGVLDDVLDKLNNLIEKGSKYEWILDEESDKYILVTKGQEINERGFMPKFSIEAGERVIDKYMQGYDLSFKLNKGKETDEIEWGDNLKLENDNDYGVEINEIINDINNNRPNVLKRVLNKDGEAYVKVKEFSNKFIPDNEENKKVAFAYMDTVKVDNKYIYKDNTEKKEQDYKSPGKWAEYIICGTNNKLAKQMWGKGGNMQVTDGIISDIYSRMIGNIKNKGLNFCIDNVDLNLNIFSESKAYTTTKFLSFYNINMNLKQTYYHELLRHIRDHIEDHYLSNNEKIKKKLLEKIELIRNILINRKEFDKEFYKNNTYMGIGISINKFNKMTIPTDYDFNNSPSTQKEIEYVMDKQDQLYTPIIDNERYITGMKIVRNPKEIEKLDKEIKIKEDKKGKLTEKQQKVLDDRKSKKDVIIKNDDFFDETFNNEVIRGKRFKYVITVKFSDVVAIFNYTDNKLIDGDFLPRTFKVGYSFDAQEDTDFNSIIIPIEQFIVVG